MANHQANTEPDDDVEALPTPTPTLTPTPISTPISAPLAPEDTIAEVVTPLPPADTETAPAPPPALDTTEPFLPAPPLDDTEAAHDLPLSDMHDAPMEVDLPEDPEPVRGQCGDRRNLVVTAVTWW